MRRYTFYWLVYLAALACSHPSAPRSEQPPATPVLRSALILWVDYLAALEAMSSKDLKNEGDRWRRISERDWDEDLRLGLVAAVQHTKNHNFQKAAEIIGQLNTKAQAGFEVKAWLKLYAMQLNTAAGLERELGEEKRQRLEQEKKLRALSDIEIEMSERAKISVSPRSK